MNKIDLHHKLPGGIKHFFKSYWRGGLIILVATLFFFWPVVVRFDSYSEGGDAMFNAYTLARDQHCILREGCPSYVNANIFFPHKDSMLYSETQLSAGLVTLPLYFINDNPIFSYNIAMVSSFFLMGFFMYMLAKYLTKNKEFLAILAGILFEFSPFRMPSISHLQNISIFYLPLAVLLIFKYIDTKKRGYLIGLLIALILQFYASWYQMVFVLIALVILLAGFYLFKIAKAKPVLILAAVVVIAALTTLPLAKSYAGFSKENDASFSLQSQATYSASLLDYVTPQNGTLLGKIFYHFRPQTHLNSYDPDSDSYYGFTLGAVALIALALAYKQRKKDKKAAQVYGILVTLAVIALAGFLISFGPVLKIRASFFYHFTSQGFNYVIPMPYLLVDKFLPQLSFMRALGRSGVLILFSLCCMLALAPTTVEKVGFYKRHRWPINCIVVLLIVFELFPIHREPMRTTSYDYNLSVPAVYKFIKNDNQVNNILILAADFDYPKAGAIPVELPEETMWAGYTNKNIFNGYSGYLPPDYYPEYYNYLDFRPAVVPLLKQQDLHYVLVDKQLSTSNPNLPNQVGSVLGKNNIIYQDQRYVLFRVTY